jgi:transcriptional regulator with XRE-family HTH domain
VTLNEVLRRLNGLVAQAGGQSALAARIGCSPSYISNTLRGAAPPGQKLLDGLGMERVVSYRDKARKAQR